MLVSSSEMRINGDYDKNKCMGSWMPGIWQVTHNAKKYPLPKIPLVSGAA